MEIKETAEKIFQANSKQGFWDEERNFAEMLMLVVSELSEAVEADRKGRSANIDAFGQKTWTNQIDGRTMTQEEQDERFKLVFAETIKDSKEDEIADAIIRLLDVSAGLGIDIEFHIKAKMRYNSLRPYKHGKKY